MRAREHGLWAQLRNGIAICEQQHFPLPGVADAVRREVFLRQLVDSVRRVRYVSVVANRPIDADRADGLSPFFDPIRAAVLKRQSGDFDEACWLVFLFVHFGRHPISGYRYAREVYSALGQRGPWTFRAVAADFVGVRLWLTVNEAHLRRGTGRGFGNHRKYLSLSGDKPNATGDAFETYVRWVRGHGSHENLFARALEQAQGNPEIAFESLFKSMDSVASFARMGKFDYLTMVQKLGFAAIRPGRPYFESNTTGPNKGARAMFETGTGLKLNELEQRTKALGACLGVGMQEMEDALCNWGKDTSHYTYFRG